MAFMTKGLDAKFFCSIFVLFKKDGALVYRLGHKIFILGRGVRLPWALQERAFSRFSKLPNKQVTAGT